jgi:YD repeat-containing protein
MKISQNILLILSLHFFIVKGIYCQQNIISAAPEAASLNQFINYPVSFNTGLTSISIPLYTISVNGISLPIELKYHASGIKVGQQSSWAGLGWDLTIEPQITCSINGLPDVEAYIPNTFVGAWGTSSSRDAYYLNNLADGLVDEQPDEYTYQLLSSSGAFMFRKTDVDSAEIVTIPYRPIKITGSTSFQITDEMGRRYFFDKTETTNPNLYKGIVYSATAWKCSKIISASGKDTLFFNYNEARGVSRYFANERTEVIDSVSDPTVSRHRATINNYSYSSGYGGTLAGSNPGYPYSIGETNWGGPGTYMLDVIEPTGIGFHYGYIFQGNSLANTHYDVMGIAGTQTLTLNEIDFRGGKLSIYSRTNNGAGSRIDSIKVFDDKGQMIKKIEFFMRYINPGNVSQSEPTSSDFRMFLDSVIISGTKPFKEKYSFEYIPNGINDHWTHSFGKKSDFWGYYQGGYSSDIYYGTSVPAFQNINIFDPNAPEIFLTNYNASFGGVPATAAEQAMQIYTLKKIFFPTGGKTEFEYAANKYLDNGELKDAGGLRIEKIKMYDNASDTNTTMEKIYKYGEGENGAGDIKINPSYAVYSYSQDTHDVSDASNIYARKRTFLSRAVGDIFYQNGSAVNYRVVTEYQKDNGNITGKTVYRYAPFDASSGTISYFNGYREQNTDISTHHIEINGGELLSTTKYAFKNNAYTWIEKDSNTYTKYVQDAKIYIGKVFRTKVYGSPSLFSTYGSVSDFKYVAYPQEVGAMLLSQNEVLSRSIDNPNNIISKTTNFYYDNVAHLQTSRIETFTSDGNSETVSTTYPLDYASGTAFIDSMKNKNLVSYPIEQVKYLQRDSTATILSGIINRYQNIGNGLIDTLFTFEPLTPLNLSSYKFSNRTIGVLPPTGTATEFSKDTHYKEKLIYNNYDIRSNLLMSTPKDNSSVSYLWDYNQKYSIAKAINASQTDIAFTSFEADGKGNWTYSGTPAADATAPTGKLVFTIADTANKITKTGLSTSKTYIVSYWKKSGTVTVNSTTPVSGSTIDGWTYYEHKVVNPSGGTITVSGTNGVIDELRLYPDGAQMTTYTYKPLIGMTSQCDANNRITYYEYDGFGRLMIVRDQDKKVLKKICYNYAGQPESCLMYGNQSRSQVFRKNDCTGCQIGEEVTYTVAANTYYATSQEEANTLAQNDIDANGQGYANANGTSCTAPVMTNINGYNGISGKRFTLLLHNNCTGTEYYIYLDPGASGVDLNPQIPTGNYNVTITPDGGSGPYSYSFASFYQYASTASFLGIDITTTKRYLAIQP